MEKKPLNEGNTRGNIKNDGFEKRGQDKPQQPSTPPKQPPSGPSKK